MVIKESPVAYDLTSKMTSVSRKFSDFAQEFSEFVDMFKNFQNNDNIDKSDFWYTQMLLLSNSLDKVNKQIYDIEEEM